MKKFKQFIAALLIGCLIAPTAGADAYSNLKIRVREVDGTPSVYPIRQITVSNGTLTDDSGGNVTVVTDTAPPGSDTQVIFNLAGAFGGEAAFTYDYTTNTFIADIIQAGQDGTDGSIKIFADQATDRTVTINPHAAMTQDVTYTLPADDGDASQFLQTDGGGDLVWATVTTSVAYDDIGDPDANSSLDFTSFTNTWTSSTDTMTFVMKSQAANKDVDVRFDSANNVVLHMDKAAAADTAYLQFETAGFVKYSFGTEGTDAFFAQLRADLAAGDAFTFQGRTGIELTAASGTQSFFKIGALINQTSTGGYTAFEVDITETSTGSGEKLIFDYLIGGSTFLKLANDGDWTLTLPTNNPIIMGEIGNDTNYNIIGLNGSVDASAATGIMGGNDADPTLYVQAGGDGNDINFRINGGQQMLLDATGLIVGGGTAGVDYIFTMNGQDADGVITWMEDEDFFRFEDDLLFNTGAGLPYGDINAVDNAAETAIATQGVAVQVLIFDTNGPSNLTTGDFTTGDITISESGDYFVSVSATVNSVSGAASRFQMTVEKNNGAVLLPGLHVDRNITGGGGESASVGMSGIVTLTAADTIEVWIENETNTQNYIVEDINLSLIMIGK